MNDGNNMNVQKRLNEYSYFSIGTFKRGAKAMSQNIRKVAHINGMFNMLEQQIIHSKDMALFRNEFFYVNHEHRENYEALLIYYKNSIDNPVVDGACYIVALPEIFDKVDVFESELPFTWVYDENGITETMKSISIPLQYLIAAALEVTDVNLFKPSGFTMGMNN